MGEKLEPSSEKYHVPKPVVPTTAMPPKTVFASISVTVDVPEPLLMNESNKIVRTVSSSVEPIEGNASVN